MSNLSNEQLENLLTLADAATPGPWHWDIRPQSNSVTLAGGRSGWDTVMDTARWGMGGATVRMVDPEVPGCLMPVHVDAVPFPGRDHHKHWARTINPARVDAAYIAAAHPGTVRLLIQELLQHRAAAHATGEAGEAGEAVLTERELLEECESTLAVYLETDDYPDRFDAERLLIALRAALTPAPAQVPQPAAPRCGGGGVGEQNLRATVEHYNTLSDSLMDLIGKWQDGLENPNWEAGTELLETLHAHNRTAPVPACSGTCRTCQAAGDAGEAEGAKEGGSHE